MEAALRSIHGGKASSDRVGIDIFKRATDPNLKDLCCGFIPTDLAALFNRIYTAGLGVPQEWLDAYISPIYKGKGSPHDPDNYRPITVSATLYKLYTTILNTRLTTYLETNNLRAATQFGFRQHLGPELALFVVNHCIDATCSGQGGGGANTPLFAATIDLRKAFDSVDRTLLWTRLQHLGVTGLMLDAIQDLYRSTSAPVKAGPNVSQIPVTTYRGVKQGCPLSPTLFGVFIDQVVATLLGAGVALGVTLAFGVEVRDLLFADDIILLSRSASNLQLLLDALHGFCHDTGMEVNLSKTEALRLDPIRGRTSLQPWQLTYAGAAVPIVDEARYLGAWLHSRLWLKNTGPKLDVLAKRAMWALWQRMKQLGINCLETQLRLLHTLVITVGEYACQVWGVHFLDPAGDHEIFKSPLQHLILYFLRLCTGAHSKTSRWVLLANAGLQPLQVRWAVICATHWGNCASHPGLPGQILRCDVDLFQHGNKNCWTYKFLKCMCDIGLLPTLPLATLQHTIPIDTILDMRFSATAITEGFTTTYDRLHGDLAPDPRTAPSTGIALSKYYAWFASKSLPHLTLYDSDNCTRTLHRFRVGSTPLRTNDFRLHHQPRALRVCRLCTTDLMEDERHILLECPAYSALRNRSRLRSAFLQPGLTMPQLMGSSDQSALARLIQAILRLRALSLAPHGPTDPLLHPQPLDADSLDPLIPHGSVDDPASPGLAPAPLGDAAPAPSPPLSGMHVWPPSDLRTPPPFLTLAPLPTILAPQPAAAWPSMCPLPFGLIPVAL